MPAQKRTDDRPVLTAREAAELLHVCDKTIYHLIERGALRTLPHIRKKLIPRISIEEYIESAMAVDAA